ncbi:MAG: glycosyltransferase [Lachnospiraceae bacterium]|nr:glycosyltransferase [Lachnospiraceae bacterium]
MKQYNHFSRNDITLVVCAYKECVYLKESIQSIMDQKAVPQVLIATSTPNAYIQTIADEFQLKVCVNPDGGQVKDYNFAMQQGSTPLIMLMHQDEVLHPSFVEKVLQELNYSKDPIIAFTNYIEMHNDIIDEKASTMVRIKRILLWPLMLKPLARHGFGKRWIQLFGNPIAHPTVVCVRERMPRVCFREEYKASMDWDLWERLSTERGSFAYISDVLLYHRMNDENQTSKLFKTTNSRYEEETDIFSRFWPKWIVRMIMHFYSKASKYY